MTEKQHHEFKTKQSEDASGQDTEKSTTTILDANVTSVNSVVSDVSTKEKKCLEMNCLLLW